jgi:hypothetical protein
VREVALREQRKDKSAFVGRVTKRQIGKSRHQLQVALQRVEAPAGLANRVQARGPQNTAESVRLKPNRTGNRAIRSALCMAMIYLIWAQPGWVYRLLCRMRDCFYRLTA